MKAIVYTQYGSPDVLQVKDVEKPTPKDNEVLVKIHAASANPADWHTMRGAPFLARLVNGLFKPKNPRLGADVAGRVEAVGRTVTQFQVGDDVFGCMPLNEMSSFAEYVCAKEDTLVLKPAKMTFEQVAAVPLAAFTALQGLRDKGVKTELIVYKGFGHGISKPKERLAANWHNWQWFNKYVWGENVALPTGEKTNAGK